MKKNILLILLSASLLSGCELDISIQRFFGLIKEEPQTEQNEENKENDKENHENNNENEVNPGGGETNEGENEQTPPAQNEYVETVYTYGTAISEFATSAGVQVDTDLSSGAGNATKLTNCLKAQLKYEECLTSAWFEKINTAEWDNKCIVQVGTGNPAKGNFNIGTFKWNSSAKIYRVEIEAQCYAKPPYSEDSDAKLKIDNETPQALKTGGNLDFQTIIKEYESGTNSFTIQSIHGRVLLRALKITWRF